MEPLKKRLTALEERASSGVPYPESRRKERDLHLAQITPGWTQPHFSFLWHTWHHFSSHVEICQLGEPSTESIQNVFTFFHLFSEISRLLKFSSYNSNCVQKLITLLYWVQRSIIQHLSFFLC